MKYRFYPSLLDSFQYYLNFPNQKNENSLLSKINRIKFDKTTQIEKGIEFENLINNLLNKNIVSTHMFKYDVIQGVLDHLENFVDMQKFISFNIEDNGVEVEVCGILDYLLNEKCIDLKTTEKYYRGKYSKSIQLMAYPLALKQNGILIKKFEFLVTNFNEIFNTTKNMGQNFQ